MILLPTGAGAAPPKRQLGFSGSKTRRAELPGIPDSLQLTAGFLLQVSPAAVVGPAETAPLRRPAAPWPTKTHIPTQNPIVSAASFGPRGDALLALNNPVPRIAKTPFGYSA